jgi:tetratricopeptide (TPR) repeat protein
VRDRSGNRLNLGTAIAVIGLFGMTSAALAAEPAAAAPTDACGVRKMTKKLEKPLSSAQDARGTKNWQQMLEKANEAEAVPVEKSEYDNFWIHEFRGIANANLKQYPEALKDLEAALNSPCMSEPDKVGRVKLIAQVAYQTKDYPKAIEYGKRSYDTNPDPDMGIYLGNSYYIINDFEKARDVLKDVIAKLKTAGKSPDEQTLRIVQSACYNIKDNDCVAEEMEELVRHYPKPNYWTDLTNSLLRVSKNDKELLNILRLADGVDVMVEPSQFTEMAQLAMGQGLPGEAQAIIEKGTAKGVFKDAREKDLATRILGEAKTAVTLDKSTLDKQDAAARAKPTGDSDVKLGAAYLSYGQNDKAIEALARGIGKGGVKSPDEAGLLLGIANFRANKIAEATTAFGTVNKDPGMMRIAKLWLLKTGAPG